MIEEATLLLIDVVREAKLSVRATICARGFPISLTP